jgi:hypothetical protein
MSDPARAPSGAPTERRDERRRLAGVAELPAGSPDLHEALPEWVLQAHLRWLETGEGDPWGGYYS